MIRAAQVRVIAEDGQMLGIMPTMTAMQLAQDQGLDLIEIVPNAEPPVCKIQEYGKYKYEHQKKQAQNRKKQKVVELKELRLRPMIDDHDFDVKMKAAKRFLEEGDKVKFTLRFRGREAENQTLARSIFERIKASLGELMKIDSEPRLEGRQMIMVASANTAATAPTKPEKTDK